MELEFLLIQSFNGLATGMTYILMALGVSLILGMLDIPNFSHGGLATLGIYLTFTFVDRFGNFWVALLLAPFLVAIVGMGIEYFFIRPLYGSHPTSQFLLLFAFSLIITEVIIIIWGPIGKSMSCPEILAGNVTIGAIGFPIYRLFLIFASGIILFFVWLFLEKTKYGAIIRAGIENKAMVSVLGINIYFLFTLTFGLGALLAGLGGALIVPIRGAFPAMGNDIMLIAFVVTVLGGMGSLFGALVGGLVVGLVQSLMAIFFPSASTISIFIIMAIILLVRPQGLFGIR